MAIQIKEGRYYKDACGNAGGPAERVANDLYPWIIKFSGISRTYTDDGARFVGIESHYTDLVSECDAEGNPIKDEAMTAAAQLVMKEGAYYEDGNGDVGGPAERKTGEPNYPWSVRFGNDPRTYTGHGHYILNSNHVHNLVREVPMPGNKAAPKPETVTITQEMINHAIQDLVSADKYADVERLVTAWSDVRRLVK